MTEILDDAGLDPAVPADRPAEPRRWWGRPIAEVRWQAELARLLVDPVFRGDGVERGDGMPALLMPGFMAGDTSLSVMHGWLERMGYAPRASGMVFNVDCSNRAMLRLDARLTDIHERTGRKTALIGHSRGAHFAKALAHRRPEMVSGVISLGAGLDTPVRHQPADQGRGGRRARRPGAAAQAGLLHRGLRMRLRAPLRGPVP